ncbi:nucleotide sugar dehydrogenase [Metallibacterium sp.]|uniref:nucleotide sugar dehydrogenase n=1 Tax=Metallibacterium sp. TaxID=2940281 RepID=UPI002612EC4D|nr:nucleotide sugar dehydrogenase [Metallibacterium sp.]
MFPTHPRIALIGLGYVGLPLALAFGREFDTLGFDINPARVDELRAGRDHTLEASAAELGAAPHLRYSNTSADLDGREVFIVTVPTPVDEAQRPDLRPLVAASETVGHALRRDAVVIYESTVYPGTTEEVCVPVLERVSGMVFNRDFFCGYSPERINPGDRRHRLETIIKVTSGSTSAAAEFVDALYRRIVPAGTHRAGSIRVAEAAKVIENTQRDVNIALINELAMIFNKMGIDTAEVLAAAGSKWNFLPFRPGLVGGHCIGVDPYYLTHKATALGYHPELMLAARRINDKMGIYVANQVLRLMARHGIGAVGARVLVLGLTFKEDCPDLRNTKVVDLIRELREAGAVVDVHDPWADAALAHAEYSLDVVPQPQAGHYDAIVLAVAHQRFRDLGAAGVRALGRSGAVIYDLKRVLPAGAADGAL